MPDEEPQPQGAQEPETESSERIEEEAPTEEHEPTGTETQDGEIVTVEVLAEEIEELRARAAERDEFLDKLQRIKADFINYQKRLQRERERWTEMALQSFAFSLLPVLDDLERALRAASENHDIATLTHGVELTQTKLLKALEEEGVVPFESLGKTFDPAFHEALAHIDRPDVLDNQIIKELRRGYLMGERVLRAAQVIVAKGHKLPEADQAAGPEEEEEETADSEYGPGESEPTNGA